MSNPLLFNKDVARLTFIELLLAHGHGAQVAYSPIGEIAMRFAERVHNSSGVMPPLTNEERIRLLEAEVKALQIKLSFTNLKVHPATESDDV